MKILVVNADCIFVNTSANLCHLAYLKGLSQAGHQVDLLCQDSKYHNIDSSMTLPENVHCRTYLGISLYERMSIHTKHHPINHITVVSEAGIVEKKNLLRHKIVQFIKQKVLSLYGVHGIYSTFVRKASTFRGSSEYDYIISLSTPTASHLLAHRLLKSGHVSAKHWIQIWEDPWATDAYGFNKKGKIFREEKRLLALAEKVCYVSPLTLQNQQQLFPESAEKMFWQPLPYYYKNTTIERQSFSYNTYGYFGAYYPVTRDLQPFYEAAKATGIEVNICGEPSNLFPATTHIHIYPRLSLNELKPIEDSTKILVFLCNLKGGQIPGKIYQYSVTDKPILFIIDGTESEKKLLKEYFGQFNRYIFCQNTIEDIISAIRRIESGEFGDVKNIPLDEFNPVKTVTNILRAGK